MDPTAASNAPVPSVSGKASHLERVFRIIVLISLATSIITYIESYLLHLWTSEESLDLLGWSGYEAVLTFPTAFWNLWMLVLIAVSIGLLGYSSAARAAFTMLSIAGCLLCAVSGVQVFTAFTSVVGSFGALSDGGIIALSYFSDLRSRFDGKS